ncbi:hypothetical protein ACYRFS_06675 [Listeria kieliensis]|uniref:Uncharacterized protein n=1 Tax=Listeria kieliensis TaxID=1621700 RepID=A0A3D8TQM6_9LIST|nr:hypothetical protein [Listeria kieliensis]RDX00894.1 hypothetical protein UR08_07975 [Listeria kieliensis]
MKRFKSIKFARIRLSRFYGIYLLFGGLTTLYFALTFLQAESNDAFTDSQVLMALSPLASILFVFIPCLLIFMAILPEVSVLEMAIYRKRQLYLTFHLIKFVIVFLVVLLPCILQYVFYLYRLLHLQGLDLLAVGGSYALIWLEAFLLLGLLYLFFLILIKNKGIALMLTYSIFVCDALFISGKLGWSFFWKTTFAKITNFDLTIQLTEQLEIIGKVCLLLACILLIFYKKDVKR